MKKSLPTPAVQDQVFLPCESKRRGAAKPPRFVTRLAPTLLGKSRAVSYIPGEKPRKEPSVLPRLFIRGPNGGSIKLDLGGVGIGFSKAAFAHLVADHSLLSLHVCPGDIALIEPAVRRVHNGNLMLLEINGQPVIRRLRREKRLWMLDLVGRGSDGSIPFAELGIQGVVIGFVRLFNEIRPVRYEGTDANFSMGFEVPVPPKKRWKQAAFLENPCSRVRLARGGADLGHLFSVNELGEEKTIHDHGSRPAGSKVLQPVAMTSVSSCATDQDADSAGKGGNKRRSGRARQQEKLPPADSLDTLLRERERLKRENLRLLRANNRLIRQMLADDQAALSRKHIPPAASHTDSPATTDLSTPASGPIGAEGAPVQRRSRSSK